MELAALFIAQTGVLVTLIVFLHTRLDRKINRTEDNLREHMSQLSRGLSDQIDSLHQGLGARISRLEKERQ